MLMYVSLHLFGVQAEPKRTLAHAFRLRMVLRISPTPFQPNGRPLSSESTIYDAATSLLPMSRGGSAVIDAAGAVSVPVTVSVTVPVSVSASVSVSVSVSGWSRTRPSSVACSDRSSWRSCMLVAQLHAAGMKCTCKVGFEKRQTQHYWSRERTACGRV
jgi:hypothetical protein